MNTNLLWLNKNIFWYEKWYNEKILWNAQLRNLWGKEGVHNCLFSKIEKCPDFGKNALVLFINGLSFTFKGLIEDYLGEKTLPCRAFLSFVVDKILIKVFPFQETSSALKNSRLHSWYKFILTEWKYILMNISFWSISAIIKKNHLKIMKSAFCFTEKVLVVLEIFKFLYFGLHPFYHLSAISAFRRRGNLRKIHKIIRSLYV